MLINVYLTIKIMNKKIKQLEIYESPNLNVFNVKPMQCVAQSNPMENAEDGGELL